MRETTGLKIKLVSFLLAAIPLAVICYFYIYENISERKEAEINKNILIVKSSAFFLEHEIFAKLDHLETMTSTPPFQKLNEKTIKKVFKEYESRGEIVYFVADREGRITAHNQKNAGEIFKLQKEPLFEKALKGKSTIGGMQQSVFTGRYNVVLYVPIINSSKEIVGVAGGYIPIQVFKKYIDQITLGKSSFLSLLDENGNYIYDKTVDNSEKLVFARCFLDGKGQDINIIERRSVRSGKKTVFTKAKFKNLGWYLVAFQPSSDLQASAMATVSKHLITLALLIGIVVMLWRYRDALEKRKLLIKRQNAEKLALIGELAAGMAHEIRNPLTTVKGFADLLKSRDRYREDKEIFEMISQSVDHIEGIVNETLLLAKPQKMRVENVDLLELLRETLGFMKNEALLRDISLDLEGVEFPVLVKGDRLHLKQLLVNLIKNALEATSDGGWVRLRMEKTNQKTANILIRDNGTGIKPEMLNKLGTPFFTTKDDGTGLGISVCRRIVEEHKGALNFTSAPGEGTTVEITLPVSN